MIYGLKYEVCCVSQPKPPRRLINPQPCQDLHRIIQAYYPKERAGSRYISERSYRLLLSADSRVAAPSTKLRAGMTLEMSMVLRERASFLAQRRACPVCKEGSESKRIPQSLWRKWCVLAI